MTEQLLHASCAAHGAAGVLILGRPGTGKSSLLLRLIDRGFELVADDCVLLDGATARAPERLHGLLEVRGLGIYRLPARRSAAIRLVVEAAEPGAPFGERIAPRRLCPHTAAPAITLDLRSPGSAGVVALAVSCLHGRVDEVAGPLGPSGMEGQA